MTRIHKCVERILKQKMPRVEARLEGPPGEYGMAGVAESFQGWAEAVTREFIGDPGVDMLAAEWGMSADELIERSHLVIYFKLLTPEGFQEPDASADADDIAVDIPWHMFSADRRGEVIEILYHELAHVADRQIGTQEYAPSSFEGWINDSDEHDSMKATIRDMIDSGYTDDEIVGLFWQHYSFLLDTQPEEDTETFLRVIREILAEVNAEYEPMLERT